MLDTAKSYLVIALVGVLGATFIHAKNLSKDLSVASKHVLDLEQAGREKDALIKEFSASFQSLSEETSARQKRVEDALAGLKGRVEYNASLSNKILYSTPKSADLCKEANDLINSYLANRK